MAGETPIAKLVAELGFKIDVEKLKAFEKTLNNVEKKMSSLQIGEKRDLDIRLKKLKIQEAEERLSKLQAKNRELSFLTDKKNLQVAKEHLRIEEIRARMDRANALNMARIHNLNARTAAAQARASASGGGIHTPGGRRGSGATAAFGGGLVGWSLLSGSHLTAAAGGFGIGYGLSQVNTLVNDISSLSLSLRSITGSAEGASKALDFLKAESVRVGFDYFGAAQGYKNILAATAKTPLGARGGQEIFSGFMEYSTAFGSTEEQKQRGLNALQQMLSKKRIYAEELTQQLSESIPGATQIFADALAGGDTAKLRKMLESGAGVDSIEALPKIIRYMREAVKEGGALEARAKSLANAQNLFKLAWISLVDLLARSGFEKGQAKIFRAMGNEIDKSTKMVEEFGKAWEEYVSPAIISTLQTIGDIVRGLWEHKEVVGIIAAAMAPWTTATLAIVAAMQDIWLYYTDDKANTFVGQMAKQHEEWKSALDSIKSIYEWIINNIPKIEVALGGVLTAAGIASGNPLMAGAGAALAVHGVMGVNDQQKMNAAILNTPKSAPFRANGSMFGMGNQSIIDNMTDTMYYGGFKAPSFKDPMKPVASFDFNFIMPDGSKTSKTATVDLNDHSAYTSGFIIPVIQ